MVLPDSENVVEVMTIDEFKARLSSVDDINSGEDYHRVLQSARKPTMKRWEHSN